MGRRRFGSSMRPQRKKVNLTRRKNVQKKYFNKWRKKTKGGQFKLHAKAHKTGTHSWGSSHSFGQKRVNKWTHELIKHTGAYTNGVTSAFQLTNTVGIQTWDVNDNCTIGTRTDLNFYTKCGLTGVYQKVFLKHMVINLKATNQTDSNVILDFYEYKFRQTAIAAVTGMGYLYNQSAGPTYPQNTPFQDANTVAYVKVLKVTRYILAQGESLEHVMHIYPNKWINAAFTNVNDDGLCIRDYTYGLMPIQIGMPYNDSTTKTQVSLGKNVVDYVVSKHFYSYGITDTATADNDHNNLVTSFTIGEDIMNEDTGLAVGLVQA